MLSDCVISDQGAADIAPHHWPGGPRPRHGVEVHDDECKLALRRCQLLNVQLPRRVRSVEKVVRAHGVAQKWTPQANCSLDSAPQDIKDLFVRFCVSWH